MTLLFLTCFFGSFVYQEVIALTAELISQPSATPTDGASGADSGVAGDNESGSDAVQWKIGDSCMALYQDDGQ